MADVVLGGLTLPDVWIENLAGMSNIVSEVDRTVAGNVVVWEMAGSGVSFDLIGIVDQAWIGGDSLAQLQALASAPYATYDLTINGAVKVVRFRNEEAPVIEANPIIPGREDVGSEENYSNNLRIKLMEV